ncbi:MAG: GGDEF domain-containing protein [Sphaerochaeta sp.]|nr:GGDEF domain-containing protein [Sphaerochaeta sp.]
MSKRKIHRAVVFTVFFVMLFYSSIFVFSLNNQSYQEKKKEAYLIASSQLITIENEFIGYMHAYEVLEGLYAHQVLTKEIWLEIGKSLDFGKAVKSLELDTKNGEHYAYPQESTQIPSENIFQPYKIVSNQLITFHYDLANLGKLSLVVDVQELLQETDFILLTQLGYIHSLSVIPLPGDAEMILSQSRGFSSKDPVISTITIGEATWQLSIQKTGYWLDRKHLVIDSLIALVLCVLTALVVSFVLQLTDQKMVLNERSCKDYLTGAGNRRVLDAQLALRLRSTEKGFVYCYMDMDRFKSINDQYGHLMGDLLLQQSAKRISSCLGKKDVLCRVGGDEFIVILDSKESYLMQISQIQETMKEPFILDGITIYTSLSIGWALFPEDGKDLSSLTVQADQLMYLMKEEKHKKGV